MLIYRHSWSTRLCAFAATTAVCATSTAARAQSAEDFFKKAGHLTMIVGSGAGGGYDQIARFVGRHLSRFLPG